MNRRKWGVFLLIVWVLISQLLAGCSSAQTAAPTAGDTEKSESGVSRAAVASSETPARKPEMGSKPAESSAPDGEMDAATPALGEGVAATSEDKLRSEESIFTNQQVASGQLTAGEWNDLENWDFWVRLLNNQEWAFYQGRWRFNTFKKIEVVVKDGQQAVNDAKVVLYDKAGNTIWTAKTNNKGTAYLFTELYGSGQNTVYDLVVEEGQNKKKVKDVKLSLTEPIRVELSSSQRESNVLDLMFVVDTTGSMQDELDYLTAELKSVIKRVNAETSGELDIRLSCNYYRDYGDDYIVKSFPFTKNIDEVIKQMNKQYADGGGDYEEAVEAALKDAVEEHKWSPNAKARLLFLVLDAPPHHNEENIASLHDTIQKAAAKGIRIIPIASSGVDKDTEFLMRFFSISTGGRYVFLTNHSGIGDSHIEPTVGDYKVEFLNDLIVRIINEYTE